MAARTYRTFVAYPGSPSDLADPIKTAAERASKAGEDVLAWPAMATFGASIPNEVRASIEACEHFYADLTRPNLNVYFESGFAIGSGKTFAPLLNTSFANATASVSSLGLFANIGYETYENSEQLANHLTTTPKNVLIDLYASDINFSQPIFFLDTLKKTDFRNAVVSAIKSSRSHYRGFDPVETPRISVIQLIQEITGSSGIVIPFLPAHIDDAERHNLRGAVSAGLAMGLGRNVLIITDQAGGSGPTDYEDNIVVARDQQLIEEKVGAFCAESVLAAQDIPRTVIKAERSLLQNLSLGASAAENEFRDLSSYFVETSEYLRAVRGELNVITGRKGSGKSAIFFQVRDTGRLRRGSINVDLRPESHQLSNFRSQIISTAGVGVFEHTIAAFWYFVALSEVLLNVYRTLENGSRYDGRLLEPMRVIENVFSQYNILEPGDFTTRLTRLSTMISRELKEASRNSRNVSVDQVTNMIYRGGISKIRDLVVENSSARAPITFLFDNIDKGWPATGVEHADIAIVRLLIEALGKVQHDLAARDREFNSIVFIRHDIYDLVMDQTPDRGKSGQVSIDWTDRAKLTQVIYKRLQVSVGDKRSKMTDLWHRLFPRKVGSSDSFDYFLDHCLMRPRILIDLIDGAVANAINRGRRQVDEIDCVDSVRQYSLSLVDDFGFEMRDVSGISSEILYALIGLDQHPTQADVVRRFEEAGFEARAAEQAFELMLWYGLLGISTAGGKGKYIYDYQYNMKRLRTEIGLQENRAPFTINPALYVGLES